MLLPRILLAIIAGGILALILFPDIRNEAFTGIRDSGFNRRVAFESRQILDRVGKEPLPRQPVFTDDPKMGNARRDMSRLPSTEGSGFSLPVSYTHYKVPDFKDGYDIALMNAPRASETYHTPRSDAFHLYYQTLHDTLDNPRENGYIVSGTAPL
jgi:hypothetical protein